MAKLSKLQKYQYATVILSAAVFIMIVVLFDLSGRIDVWDSNPLRSLSSNVGECNMQVAEWRTENPAPYNWNAMSADAKEDLAGIIAECSESIDNETASAE